MGRKSFIYIMVLMSCLSLMSCSNEDDDDIIDEEMENGSGESQTSYTLSQLAGYWVDWEQWRWCKQTAASLPTSGTAFCDTYLEDKILSDGVDGYYITTDGTAYLMWMTVTTMKYANNDKAGNKVLKSWSCLDGKTVYFMNIEGSKSHKACAVWDNDLKVGTSYFPITSTTTFIGPNNAMYCKVNLSW